VGGYVMKMVVCVCKWRIFGVIIIKNGVYQLRNSRIPWEGTNRCI